MAAMHGWAPPPPLPCADLLLAPPKADARLPLTSLTHSLLPLVLALALPRSLAAPERAPPWPTRVRPPCHAPPRALLLQTERPSSPWFTRSPSHRPSRSLPLARAAARMPPPSLLLPALLPALLPLGLSTPSYTHVAVHLHFRVASQLQWPVVHGRHHGRGGPSSPLPRPGRSGSSQAEQDSPTGPLCSLDAPPPLLRRR